MLPVGMPGCLLFAIILFPWMAHKGVLQVELVPALSVALLRMTKDMHKKIEFLGVAPACSKTLP